MATRTIQSGTVQSFDQVVGLGTVVDTQGKTFNFHCTAIADGSRNIAVGTAVSFVLKQGALGRVEAVRVTP
jgi:cold shock CspA family protein